MLQMTNCQTAAHLTSIVKYICQQCIIMVTKNYYNMEQPIIHEFDKQTCMIAMPIPASRDSSLQKNSKNYV